MQSNHSETFHLFHEAVLGEQQVVFTYRGLPREVCPYILGHKDGVEKMLGFQFAGRSSKGKFGWKCFDVAEVRNARIQEGPWHGRAEHRKTQSCVHQVYIDVNTDVPNQPGRR